MRLDLVVPRYGPEVIGGAETAARLLGEHLVDRRGWEVTVRTTCARDFVTWAEVDEPGTSWEAGVRVERYRSTAGRDPSFHPLSAALLADPAAATAEEADRWIDLQGPVSPELIEASVGSDADATVFYPYLYHPTVRAIGRTRGPSILHPAAHDEPALRLPVFAPVFASADALVFQTAAERGLVQRTYPVATRPQLQLGLGVDDPDLLDVPPVPVGDPYLLCLGRVEGHKGTTLLAGWFAAYKARHPGPLRLVLAGPVVDAPPAHPDVDVRGPVTEAEKWSLLTGAVALVSPSAWEAFSLAVAEGWSARRPVLVHAACGATVEHCRRSGGGLWFGSYRSFEAAVDAVSGQPELATLLGRRGRAHVDRWFRWPVVIDRYAAFVAARVAAHRTA